MALALVVDDSRVVRKFSRRIVEGFGFEVDEAENGQEALEKCRQKMPDVILLDWNMPIMDGIAFLKKVRREPKGECPRIVFCTTENAFEDIAKAINAGADEFIMKPFDETILRGKLEEVGVLDLQVSA
ncbi:MAG: response regulator [Filomicrobium sp.]